VAVVLAAVRFTFAVSATRDVHVYGDFAATLPGGYAERLNPTLWNSPDLAASWAFHQHTYLHGPTQFLTLYPIVFLNSYAAIARALLFVYPFVVAAAIVMLARTAAALTGDAPPFAIVAASTLAFFPLMQAFIQREFEIVILAAVSAMLWAASRNRQHWLGAAVAYITWFKYLPLVLVPYLAIKRWRGALVSFAVTSAALLLLAQLFFGLGHFVDNQVPSVAGGHAAAIVGAVDFCQGLLPKYRFGNRTFVSVRWGVCTLEEQGVTIRPLLAFLSFAALFGATAIVGFVRLERAPHALSDAASRWRSVLELCIIVTIYSTFLFAHYYYLSVLTAPMALLLVKYVRERRWAPIALWAVAFALLSPFTIPATLLDRAFGFLPVGLGAWDWYMGHAVYLPGELLLLTLLLREYLGLE